MTKTCILSGGGLYYPEYVAKKLYKRNISKALSNHVTQVKTET